MTVAMMDSQWRGNVPTSPELQHPEDEILVVLRLRGRSSGPTLLVCGREAFCRPIYGRLMRVPSLPRLSGTLVLGYLGEREAAEPRSPAEIAAERDPFFDDALFLEFSGEDDALQERHRQVAYWTILRNMAAIGMIAGRGVPPS